jgi:predicted alpha/beta superfamily hydrolase
MPNFCLLGLVNMMDMKYLFLFISLYSSILVSAVDYSTDTIEIESKILNEIRKILIFKPVGVRDADSVSLVYLLDGQYSEYRYDKIVEAQLLKPFVGIGIMNANRNRDMLPAKQAANFLKFIEEELIPVAEADLLCNNRVLFGHSFGACFTIYAMINKPQLFEKYIASSPTPIMDMVDASVYTAMDNHLKKGLKFYFSYGSKDMRQVRKWSEVLYNNIKDTKFKHINWEHEVYQGENHNSCDVISLIKGLKY